MIEGGLDIALLVILGYFFLRGVFRGVVKEVVAVLGLFVAFWVASVYWPLGDEHLKVIFDQPSQRGITSFILIFAIVYFIISIISIFVDKIVKITITPWLSALLGAVVGVLKGILVCGILLAGAETFLKPSEKFFTNSALWPYFQPVTNQSKSWMPEALRKAMSYRRYLPPLGDKTSDQAIVPNPPAMMNMDSVDWSTVQGLLATQPDSITSAWRDKLRNINGPESFTKEDMKRFISDHPNIFNRPNGEVPSWPQPAAD